MYIDGPRVIESYPLNGTSGFAKLNANIELRFNKAMAYSETDHADFNKVTDANFVYLLKQNAQGGYDKVAGTRSYDTINKLLIFHPSSNLTPNSTYQIYVSGLDNPQGAVQDILGTRLSRTYIATFQTAATFVSLTSLISPIDKSQTTDATVFSWTAIPEVTDYTFQISKAIDFSSLVFDVTDTFIDENSIITYSPHATLEINNIYFWRVCGVGGGWSVTSQFFYTSKLDNNATQPINDNIIVLATYPHNDEVSVSTSVALKVKLSTSTTVENATESILIIPGMISAETFEEIEIREYDTVTVNITFDDTSNVCTITPEEPLAENKIYTLVTYNFFEYSAINFLTMAEHEFGSVQDMQNDVGTIGEVSNIRANQLLNYYSALAHGQLELRIKQLAASSTPVIIDFTNPPEYITQYVRYAAEHDLLTSYYLDMASTSESKTLGDFKVSASHSMSDIMKMLDWLKGRLHQAEQELYSLGEKFAGPKNVIHRAKHNLGNSYPEYMDRGF